MKVLFICYANVCRSFIAQELLKNLAPNLQVFSRGLYANPSFSVPPKVYSFFRANNLPLTSHTPTPLRETDLHQADIIFCMETSHLNTLLDKYAQHTDKMWLLSDFALGKEYNISDPITLNEKSFIKSMQKLTELINNCAKKLAKNY